MLFYDTENKRQVDVFVGVFSMCHRLDLDGRLGEHPTALDAADLLLTKLQIAEINRKDLVDAVRLLLTHENADIGRRPPARRRDVARPAAVGDDGRLGLVHDVHRQPAAGPGARRPTCSTRGRAVVEARADAIARVAGGRAEVHALEGAQRRRPQDAVVRAAGGSREEEPDERHEDLLRHRHPRLGPCACASSSTPGKFYGVDAVVMGGDITGKMIVPVVEEAPDQYAAHIFGRKRVVDATGCRR